MESGESIPILPILEMAGDRRVLVENHCGVISYSCEQIGIAVKYGKLFVSGGNLQLTHMTKVKLVITGRIDSIAIVRR